MRVQDAAIFELVDDPASESGNTVRITSPDDVVDVRDVAELQAQLEHYDVPFFSLAVPESNFARRWYVEKVRPALRYYCGVYKVPIPPWLMDDSVYNEMSDEERIRFFGHSSLSIREFSPVKKRRGEAGRT